MPRASQPRQGLEHLRAWRVWKGYSQDDLVHLTGVAKSTISNLELAKCTANFVTVRKLAEGLGITREQLLHEEPGAAKGARDEKTAAGRRTHQQR